MPIIEQIEAFLERSGTGARTFGMRAVRDPRLVFDIRNGRNPREAMRLRIAAFIENPPHNTSG